MATNTREKVLKLSKKGLTQAEIARRVGVSSQRVGQILSRPTPRKPGRRRSPNSDQVDAIKKIIEGRDNWTWNEADAELQKHGLDPKSSLIPTVLKELGFRYHRGLLRWYKGLDTNDMEKLKAGIDMDRDTRAKEIIGSRSDWTWAEAYEELTENDVTVSANKVYDLLRDLGFVHNRLKRRWFRDDPKKK